MTRTHGWSAYQIADQERRRQRALRERLERLIAARGSAVSSVTFADRSVEFRSDAELERAINFLRREIAPSTTRNIVIRANKGW